ncbi:vWA domain-containing protein [Pseudomonas sp. 5P_3.1_Bac2]|uniref:vWA domain-containing protein n=1 Tax=Pseudomonas sp. 5P_3.1_Bac2 TaxID=2971617 RepID=UPI0021C9A1BA|nr:VWA domain-containing protein [Pseudomonas sp. 5P_3.1_Bac2]MCU1716715.1 VWA domain-containing protein [Pseudomonas sp. 5P_3.1_Bac2]
MTAAPLYSRPLWAGFSVTLLLGLVACGSATAPEPERTERLSEAASAPMRAASQPRTVLRQAPLAMPVSAAYAADYSLMEGLAPPEQPSREQYQKLPDNPVQAVAQQPVSTFSIDVDTGSYANVRRFLNDGQLPPAEAVRLEELLNYFPYAYPSAASNAPFGVSTEVTATPWNPHSRLLRIAIKAQELHSVDLPPANLVFLVDVSGSMQRREGLPLVQATLKLLVEQLRPEDRVSLVTYAGESKVVLAATSGKQKSKIRAAIEQLSAGGATAGESGIQLAYQQAQQGLIKGGINRILLATDGDFNVGISDFEALKQLAASKRKSGVSLTTLGFGTDNYNERLMEQLADAGDGNYAYIDNLREARKVLVDQLSSTLATVASDVKIQVEFNPAQVSEYRLLGYENRALKREDFSNDQVDAGEIGAGHSVTALYEVVPVGQPGWLEPLRYQAAKPAPQKQAEEMAWLRIRYKPVGQSSSKLLEQPVASASLKQPSKASVDMNFAAAVAAFAQQLKGATYTGAFNMADTAQLARAGKGEDRFGLRGEFIQLVELAQSLQAAPSDLTTDRVQP